MNYLTAFKHFVSIFSVIFDPMFYRMLNQATNNLVKYFLPPPPWAQYSTSIMVKYIIQSCTMMTYLASISTLRCWLSRTSSRVTSCRGMSDRKTFRSDRSARLTNRGDPMNIISSISFSHII